MEEAALRMLTGHFFKKSGFRAGTVSDGNFVAAERRPPGASTASHIVSSSRLRNASDSLDNPKYNKNPTCIIKWDFYLRFKLFVVEAGNSGKDKSFEELEGCAAAG